jgi:hypothetical protein
MTITASQRKRWRKKVGTIWRKSADLFSEIEAAGAEQEDLHLHALAGDTMCSAAELATCLDPE